MGDGAHVGGLRERKKRRTRETIADVAMGLFVQRGFDDVTVAEIAQAADVSVNTIFNYFGTKEEIFFDRQNEVENLWSRIVQERAVGESAVAALRRDFLAALARCDPYSGLNDGLVPFVRIIEASPTLKVREREIGERGAASLAQTLAVDSEGGAEDITPLVVANLVKSVYQILLGESRRRLLAGEQAHTILPDLLDAARRAFDLLEAGVGDYCVRRP